MIDEKCTNNTCGLFEVRLIKLTKQHLRWLHLVGNAKRDAAMGGAASAPDSPAAFPSPGLRPVALRPTLSSGLPFTSYFYPQITQIIYSYIFIF